MEAEFASKHLDADQSSGGQGTGMIPDEMVMTVFAQSHPGEGSSRQVRGRKLVLPVAEAALMKETHEEDDPHSDNLSCLENTVSNIMPVVRRSTMDFVTMNRSSCGMAYCQGNTSY